MSHNSIGNQIATERNKMHMSKKDFAKAVGITASQLSDIEHGISLISLEKLKVISKYTWAPVDLFLKGYDKKFLIFAIDDYCDRISKQEAMKAVNSIIALYEQVEWNAL